MSYGAHAMNYFASLWIFMHQDVGCRGNKINEIHFSWTTKLQLLLFPGRLQRAKKVVSDSPGLLDFAIGLVNSVFNLPDRQVIFF